MTSQGHIERLSPPPDLEAYVTGFVKRDDRSVGGVVRILPELRFSLQAQTADMFWVREQDPDSGWRQLPRLTMWGPRTDWAWGYARETITAYGLGLTPVAARAMTGESATDWRNRVVRLSAIDSRLSCALWPKPSEALARWAERAAQAIRFMLSGRDLEPDTMAPALDILASEAGNAVLRAAEACRLSPRQFQRRFQDLYGVSPKTWQRLCRVDRMLRQLHSMPWESDRWEEFPVPYADQPHAIREFRAVTGMTPQAYATAKNDDRSTLRSVALCPGAPPPPKIRSSPVGA